MERINANAKECVRCAGNIEVDFEIEDVVVHTRCDEVLDLVPVIVGCGFVFTARGEVLSHRFELVMSTEDVTRGSDFDFDGPIEVKCVVKCVIIIAHYCDRSDNEVRVPRDRNVRCYITLNSVVGCILEDANAVIA